MFQFPQSVTLPPLVQWPVSLNTMAPVAPQRFPDTRGMHPPPHVKNGANSTSNITNSTDPKAMNARVFVGNLNTIALSKDAVETIFKRYGRIIGISMHKGYAFIQYEEETEARSAVTGEDQRVFAGKQIDVNMAAEPRKYQVKRKRSHDDYAQIPGLRVTSTDATSPPLAHKRQRTSPTCHANGVAMGMETGAKRGPEFSRNKSQSPVDNQIQDCADILICGRCRQLFSALPAFLGHKSEGCRLWWSCGCDRRDLSTPPSEQSDDERLMTNMYKEVNELSGECYQFHLARGHERQDGSQEGDVARETDSQADQGSLPYGCAITAVTDNAMSTPRPASAPDASGHALSSHGRRGSLSEALHSDSV